MEKILKFLTDTFQKTSNMTFQGHFAVDVVVAGAVDVVMLVLMLILILMLLL